MIIYKTTNLLDYKSYVGQDLYNKQNYYGSGIKLILAVNKYGKENFRKDILEFCDSRKILNEREKFWIKLLRTQDPKIGYNIADGGDGGSPMLGKKTF